MIYSIRRTKTFRYDPAVRESIMEVGLNRAATATKRCLNFTLKIDPAASIPQ